MTEQYRDALTKERQRLLDGADYNERRAERWPGNAIGKEERCGELRDFAARCREAAKHFEIEEGADAG